MHIVPLIRVTMPQTTSPWPIHFTTGSLLLIIFHSFVEVHVKYHTIQYLKVYNTVFLVYLQGYKTIPQFNVEEFLSPEKEMPGTTDSHSSFPGVLSPPVLGNH